MNKEFHIVDLDSTSDILGQLNALNYWIRNNQNKKETHHIVIKREYEGEIHFQVKENFLPYVRESLKDWPEENVTIIMGDVHLKTNVKNWFAGTERKEFNANLISTPLELLRRTMINRRDNTIKKPKVYERKIKRFICLNGAAKTHRAKLVTDLFNNGLDGFGYISWINRYGNDVPDEYFTNPKFQGQELKLDFTGKEIDEGQNQEILPMHYHYAGFEIVNESIISDTSLFITEKTWKPILYDKIFIVHGCKDTMKFLIDYGFKPYTELYDHEAFDSLPYNERYRAMWNEIEKLVQYTPEDWTEIYSRNEIKEKMSHNRTVFENMTIPSWRDILDAG
jgi:hypothetical protein